METLENGLRYSSKISKEDLGPIYSKRQHQCCEHSAMMIVILFSLKSMEMLENGLQPQSGVTIVFNENRIASVIAALKLTLGVDRPYQRYTCEKREEVCSIKITLMECSHCPSLTQTQTPVKKGFNYNTQNCLHWPTPTPTQMQMG